MNTKPIRLALLLPVLAGLGGCATMPPDGRPQVLSTLQQHGLAWEESAAPGLPAELVDRPLGRADALRLALQNNPELRAQFARLGFAAADVYAAGRLANPRLSASVLAPDQGGEANQVGFGIVQGFAELLLLPAHRRLAEGQFERVQQLVASAALDLAADVDAAAIRLAALERKAELAGAIDETAQAGAELAQRFFAAGNISRLQLARERAAASEAAIARIATQAQRDEARAGLNRLMGLPADETRWRIDAELAQPPAAMPALDAMLAQAAHERLDLLAARSAVELCADAAGLTRRTRLLGALDLGIETERETDRSRITGPTLAVELPIFDQGQGRIGRAEAELALAQAELAALELDIGRAVRTARLDADAARERAQQYQHVLVPLREQIVALNQERLDFMLIGQFEALLARHEQYAAYGGYLDAVRDYWLARVALARATGTTLGAATGEPIAPPAAQPAAPDAHEDHSMHGMHHAQDTNERSERQ